MCFILRDSFNTTSFTLLLFIHVDDCVSFVIIKHLMMCINEGIKND